jgi:hypothetical protein
MQRRMQQEKLFIKGKENPYLGKEDDFQKASANYLRFKYPGALFFHVPNGGHRHIKVAAKLKAQGVLAGVPDWLICEPRKGYHGLAIELKVKGGRLSLEQSARLYQFRMRGWKCLVIYSLDEFMNAVDEYLG